MTTPTDEQVERVAKDMYFADYPHNHPDHMWMRISVAVKDVYRARAAIAAMPAPVSVAEAAKVLLRENYRKTKENEWVWTVCDGYEVIVTNSLGNPSEWSFRVNNAGRCFLKSKDVAMKMARDELSKRIKDDLRLYGALDRRLRALAGDQP